MSNKVVTKWTISQFLPPILEKDFISLSSDYLLKLHRFFYEKDFHFVCDIFNLYNFNPDPEEYEEWDFNKVLKFFNSPHAVKIFKQFLVNDYLANKVFNMIPNILRKKEENYEDEELDFAENLEEEERENNAGRLFSRKDFQDEEDEDDDFEGENNNHNLKNKNKNLHNNDPQEKHDINRLNEKKKFNLNKINMWDFPTKLGSYQNPDNSALEYIKYITNILSLDEDLSDQAFVLKKNCLKLIKVPEFSKQTEFEDPCRTFVLHDIICEYCATNKDVDFCKDVNVLSNTWTCEFCGVQFDKDFIEYLVIHKLKNLIDFYYNQDLKCSKCKMIKNEFIFNRCKCAGDYIKTFEDNIFPNSSNIRTLQDYLEVISNISNYYNFESLKAMLNSIGA